jgi:ABC-type transporter Mla subunit MlaD
LLYLVAKQMKKLGAILLLSCSLNVSSAPLQTAPARDADEQQVAALMRELREQQTQIAANQAQIDAKIAAIAQLVQQARVFVSRGGAR